MEIKSIAEAKKAIEERIDDIHGKSKENHARLDELEFALGLWEALEKSVREKRDLHRKYYIATTDIYTTLMDKYVIQVLEEVLGEEK